MPSARMPSVIVPRTDPSFALAIVIIRPLDTNIVLDRLVPTAGVRDRISAVLWVEGGQVTIVRLVEVAREDYEEPDDLLWWLQDVIDLDRDGSPDLVLASYGYEATSLAIASVVENDVVERWEGLGRGM